MKKTIILFLSFFISVVVFAQERILGPSTMYDTGEAIFYVVGSSSYIKYAGNSYPYNTIRINQLRECGFVGCGNDPYSRVYDLVDPKINPHINSTGVHGTQNGKFEVHFRLADNTFLKKEVTTLSSSINLRYSRSSIGQWSDVIKFDSFSMSFILQSGEFCTLEFESPDPTAEFRWYRQDYSYDPIQNITPTASIYNSGKGIRIQRSQTGSSWVTFILRVKTQYGEFKKCFSFGGGEPSPFDYDFYAGGIIASGNNGYLLSSRSSSPLAREVEIIEEAPVTCINIYNISGQKVYSLSNNLTEFNIKDTSLHGGVYIIEKWRGSNRTTQKVLLKR